MKEKNTDTYNTAASNWDFQELPNTFVQQNSYKYLLLKKCFQK